MEDIRTIHQFKRCTNQWWLWFIHIHPANYSILNDPTIRTWHFWYSWMNDPVYHAKNRKSLVDQIRPGNRKWGHPLEVKHQITTRLISEPRGKDQRGAAIPPVKRQVWVSWPEPLWLGRERTSFLHHAALQDKLSSAGSEEAGSHTTTF